MAACPERVPSALGWPSAIHATAAFDHSGVVLLGGCCISLDCSDTPQFRGGNPYFFRENPYQSVSFIYASMLAYSENVHAIHIAMQLKKIATLRMCSLHGNKNRQPAAKNQNRSFTSRGATVGLGLRLIDLVNRAPRGTKSPVFRKFSTKS